MGAHCQTASSRLEAMEPYSDARTSLVARQAELPGKAACDLVKDEKLEILNHLVRTRALVRPGDLIRESPSLPSSDIDLPPRLLHSTAERNRVRAATQGQLHCTLQAIDGALG